MSEIIDAWRCIGCGRVEAARPCVGICQDRRVRLVEAEDYEAAVERARIAADALALVMRLARTQPRQERWRDSFVAFRDQARRLLDDLREVEQAVAERLEGNSA